MKKRIPFLAVSLLLCLTTTASAASVSGSASNSSMLLALVALAAITLLAIVICVYLTVSLVKASRRSGHGRMKKTFRYLILCAYLVAALALVCTLVCGNRYRQLSAATPDDNPVSTGDAVDSTGEPDPAPSDGSTTASDPEGTADTTEPEPTEEPTPVYSLGTVAHTTASDPANWITKWEIIANDSIAASYSRGESITFGDPNTEDFYALPGISTFRGDNYRTGSAYGTANIVEETMSTVWTRQISSIAKGTGSGAWTGAGWTGQPLIVEWDEETKQIMNLYEEKKNKEGLVEVIYATLDGHIYFYDLDDGSYTRDPINMGMAFKGSGSLDPRGYPILYVGSGDKTSGGKVPRMYVISLIDGSVLYEYGNSEPYSLRNWIAFDSAPLVDAETDTLIWPGETGILYTIKLNTAYDKQAGTLTVSPDTPVKVRYSTNTGNTIGCEDSAIIVEHYLYIGDNGGMFFCIDLDTMELVWAQNVKDDINATPVFEWGDDGVGYLYVGSSMEFADGYVYIYKLNASTGEIVWEREFDDVYYDYVSGGILASPVLGKAGTELEGMVIFAIAKTPGAYNGILVALDTDTGETIWEKSQNLYSWSSPVAVYNDDGTAHLIICDAGGYVYMLDPANGETLCRLETGANIEASPAVYNDMLVVGTRGQQVYCIKLS